MTMTLDPTDEVARLDDFEYEATLARMRAYVDQLSQADDQADAGSLQRATDLTTLYEDGRWIEEWLAEKPIKPRRRPTDFQAQPNSRKRFFEWAQKEITSPTTGEPLAPRTSRRLLDTEEVARSVRLGRHALPEGLGAQAIEPLVPLIKNGRQDDIPRVWAAAVRTAEDKGQTLGKAAFKEAVGEYKKAVGWKTVAGKKTIEGREARIESDFDWLVKQVGPDRPMALIDRLIDRVTAEKQWARGEAS